MGFECWYFRTRWFASAKVLSFWWRGSKGLRLGDSPSLFLIVPNEITDFFESIQATKPLNYLSQEVSITLIPSVNRERVVVRVHNRCQGVMGTRTKINLKGLVSMHYLTLGFTSNSPESNGRTGSLEGSG